MKFEWVAVGTVGEREVPWTLLGDEGQVKSRRGHRYHAPFSELAYVHRPLSCERDAVTSKACIWQVEKNAALLSFSKRCMCLFRLFVSIVIISTSSVNRCERKRESFRAIAFTLSSSL